MFKFWRKWGLPALLSYALPTILAMAGLSCLTVVSSLDVLQSSLGNSILALTHHVIYWELTLCIPCMHPVIVYHASHVKHAYVICTLARPWSRNARRLTRDVAGCVGLPEPVRGVMRLATLVTRRLPLSRFRPVKISGPIVDNRFHYLTDVLITRPPPPLCG